MFFISFGVVCLQGFHCTAFEDCFCVVCKFFVTFVVFVSVLFLRFFRSFCVVNRSFAYYKGIIRKNIAVIQTFFFGAIAVSMFGISLVSGTFDFSIDC